MRTRFSRHLLYGLLTVCCLPALAAFGTRTAAPEPPATTLEAAVPADSVRPRYTVRKTTPETLDDMDEKPADLRTPENLKTEVTYDETADRYIIGTKAGEDYVDVPLYLTPEEYAQWSLRKSLQAYYRSRTSELFASGGKEKFNLADMKFDIGPAEKIFGPGGVQIKTQGSAELSFGGNIQKLKNPSLPERARNTFGFDFDEKININVNGKVGDKVNMNLNYNTDATFDFDTKKIKLKYEGKEDEIIKLLEAGNVSMPTNSSLIRGATSLFGIRADLQFGKFKVQAVVSQQESESKTVTSKGGAQLTDYEIAVADYDENRHFFLAHYFRNAYDKNMQQLPNVASGISIGRIEVWVTNKKGNYDNPRNIIAFTDLGEHDVIGNTGLWQAGSETYPCNAANTLYSTLNTQYADIRSIEQVTPTLSAIMDAGMEYEKIESARLLTSSEYTLNSKLGYLSLKQTLQPDEVLAVAFEYTKNGRTYQVGEFASDLTDTKKSLFVKLLKSTSNSPSSANWDLMMKNVYSLGAYQIQKDKFRLDIVYQSDTTGVYINYIPEGKIKKQPLIRVMNLDRLDNNNQRQPNGFFDYVEGYTVVSQNGRIFFPVVEPFGSHLRQAIGDDATADKYVYQELYDSTKTIAKQIAEKNKFKLKGKYKASSGSEIQLGAMNIPAGSVRVTAGGQTLTENVDYSVDYTMGVVTILNQSIIDAGTAVSVNLESNTNFSMQRKTMMGMNFSYDFTRDFQVGGTIMHLSEKPLTSKVAMGDEPISNTLWGLNTSWKRQSQWLTNMLDKIPLLNLTQPSSINFTAEFAQLIPGHAKGIQDNASYIDDFEQTKNGIDIHQPSYWMLASTPAPMAESKLTNDLRYGMNRALLSWYTIDPLFTRKSSSLTPSHIKNDVEQLSNHYVREVYERELYPNKDISTSMTGSSTLSVLNLAYYPDERGPYNLDTDLTFEGKLNDPAKRWGGMMRKLETSDFETANIEYVEFWMMDPFIYESTSGKRRGGSFVINLGEVSEDVLKDGKKFYENGIPVDGDLTKVEETVWGYVPKERSIVYAFDTQNRSKQDVGLNGLSSEQERTFASYQQYLNSVQGKVSPEVFVQMQDDPAGDNFHHYRGTDLDEQQASILDRYKRYNGTEGNSLASEDMAAKTTPDIEDINQDNTMNETEKYYEYVIDLEPDKMQVGENYITNVRESSVKLRNGETETVRWYQFKVPVKSGKSVNGISDLKSIRFMRMYLTNFEEPTILRLATLELVRGEWRTYEQPLTTNAQSAGTLTVAAVNLEENGDKQPVNYVIPPGVSRVLDPSQPQLVQENEQSMSLSVTDLGSGDARAVYKNIGLDLRQYRRLKMFAHAEKPVGNITLEDGYIALFIRLGSDYKNNYYEYEIPLKLTPEGKYTDGGRSTVWPAENELDILLSVLTDLKKERNAAKNRGDQGVSYTSLYSSYDPDRPANKISIVGNPSLAEVKTLMIGVRNNSRTIQSAEVWVNELRLTDFNEDGGWAAQGNLNIQLSDLGTVNLAGHAETAGFGGLEQSVSERRMDDFYQYSITTSFELGKLFPAKAKVSAPVYFSYSKEITSPLYNPLDKDMLLKDALQALANDHQRDSLKNLAQEVSTYKNFSLSNVRVGIQSKKPMPYDPANFSLGYAFTKQHNRGNTTAWEIDNRWNANFGYNYSPAVPTWEPFKKLKSKSKWLKIVKEFGVNYVPQSLAFNTDMARHYYELQTRDVENVYGSDNDIPLSTSKDFLWNRDFSLRWDLTKALKMNFSSATHAEIEEPYGPVNKDLYPDEYAVWKDSVKQSLRSLGRPLDYQQNFNLSYQLPLNKLPLFDWLTADAKFASSYHWNRGVALEDGLAMNTIDNQRSLDINGRFNLEMLYNKVPFLKATNKKFAAGKSRPNNFQRGPTPNLRTRPGEKAKPKEQEKDKQKKYEKEIQLKADTTVTIVHKLNSKKPKVTALTSTGVRYRLKYHVSGANQIVIDSRDTVKLKLTILPGQKPEEKKAYQMAQYAARFLMMVRNVSITYRNTYAMTLPGYMPEVGDMLGQKRQGGLFAPGLDFAFGMAGDGYIQKAQQQGWLSTNDSIVDPATTNAMEDVQVRVSLEPVRDLKIDLNASRTVNKSRSIQYMFEGMPETRSGNFSMTVITLGNAFGKSKAKDGYRNKTFDRFLGNLDVMQRRVEALYADATYPHSSIKFDPANGTVDKYSPDVMIPAFLAAYTGRDSHTSSLDFFPKLLSMMPNWKVTYSGLSKLDCFKKVFKSFNINHAYRSIYSVGSYSTYQNFWNYMGDRGFIQDVTNEGSFLPSSIYDINTVSINEQFSPLIGVDMTFHNNLTAKVEYKKTRVLTLSMAANQLVENGSKDFVVGLGYKVVGLKLFGGGGGKGKASTGKAASGKETRKGQSVSNDLNLRADFSLRNQSALCRDIQAETTQATSGNKALKLSVSADYVLSRLLTLRLYFDREKTIPLVSSTSYPVTNSDFGVTLKFSLTR
ncbi:MAG: cell surface protein SprA [Bacteroidaceae bacterium]